MKQIEKVSIGGYAFTLEKEASQAVASYLKEMSSFYPNPEIVEGIEERMAELLLERTPQNGVVTLASIQQIIDILGRPEKIEEEEPERTVPEEKPRKKLYRDMENARVAGVCSGLAAFFDVDPTIFRILFLVCSLLGVFGGVHDHGIILPFTVAFISFPTLYLILWICMPAARTARQRWEQKGEDGTAESIRRSIESGAAEIGEAANRIGNYPAWGRFGRAVEVIMGLILLIVAVAGLFAEGLGIFGGEWLGLKGVFDTTVRDLSYEYPQVNNIISTPWVMILILVVIGLPFIGMLYASIMMLFHFKSPSWHPGLVIFILWLIAVVALAVLFFAGVFSADLNQHRIFISI